MATEQALPGTASIQGQHIVEDPASDGPLADASEEGVHLPDIVVKHISSFLVSNESPGFATLNLLALAGTCHQWRSVVSNLDEHVCLGFDGFDNSFSSQPSAQRFRKLNPQQKEHVFLRAARLFNGFTEVAFAGEGVTDALLTEVAETAGQRLVKARVHSTNSLTDDGLIAFITSGNRLVSLSLEDLPKSITGKFLLSIFENCKNVKILHLSNIPSLNWNQCKESAALWPEKAITKLHIRGVNLDPDFGTILSKLPHLQELEIDGPARNLKAASIFCPAVSRVSYQVSCRSYLDEALEALKNLKELKQLELIVKNFTLCSSQLREIGSLPLVELRLDSFIFKQQPTLSRSNYSHVDNEGVKALVDAICNRWCSIISEMRPLKLSLCGATALTHDAVSALLRLPILTELDIVGCCRIIAMDKMRLVAKVRAGREMLESARKPGARSSRFPGLVL